MVPRTLSGALCVVFVTFAQVGLVRPAARAARPAEVDPVVARVDGAPVRLSAAPGPGERDARTERAVDAHLLLAECARTGQTPSAAAVRAALLARVQGAADPANSASPASPVRTARGLRAGALAAPSDARQAVRLRLCTEALLVAEDAAPVDEAALAAWFGLQEARFARPARAVGRLFEIDAEALPAGAGPAEVRAALLDAGGGPGAGGGAPRHRPVDASDPAWGATLVALRPGEVGAPTRFGAKWCMVSRLPDRPEAAPRLATVRAEAERIYRQERRATARRALLERLRAAAQIVRIAPPAARGHQ